jgi:large subunit ribosomal protein L18
MKNQKLLRDKRRARIRAKVSGTKETPRLSVFRSNVHISAQLINDEKGETLVSASTKSLDKKEKEGKSKSENAFLVGNLIAKLAKEKKITKVVFDRGGYRYHGRVAKLAEGAREGGLIF